MARAVGGGVEAMSRVPMGSDGGAWPVDPSSAFPTYFVPQGVSAATPKPTEIVLNGIDKQQLGQVAAEIRKFRPPEPYKGKGVKYAEETIVRKEGKKK